MSVNLSRSGGILTAKVTAYIVSYLDFCMGPELAACPHASPGQLEAAGNETTTYTAYLIMWRQAPTGYIENDNREPLALKLGNMPTYEWISFGTYYMNLDCVYTLLTRPPDLASVMVLRMHADVKPKSLFSIASMSPTSTLTPIITTSKPVGVLGCEVCFSTASLQAAHLQQV